MMMANIAATVRHELRLYQEEKFKRDQWWKILNILRTEYKSKHQPQTELGVMKYDTQFNDWMAETYGVKIIYTHDGMIGQNYEIVDGHKHLVLILKYT